MLRSVVNSFDIFDTLIARRGIWPTAIPEELERAFSAQGFSQARRACEHRLASAGKAFRLSDIYQTMVAERTLTTDDARLLFEAEVLAEFDHAVPIVENLSQVSAGDLLVSDMYLPRDMLRRLLHHVGLRLPVTIVVSNHGKHHGDIWASLSKGWLIKQHLGDNPHSDVEMPRRHGIHGVLCTQARLTPVEQLVLESGYPVLAQVMRTCRLGNPLPSTSVATEVWNAACQFNLPLLVLGAAGLRRQRDALGLRRILFSDRDCYLLAEIFSLLHPADDIDYIHVSREVLQHGSKDFLAYLDEVGLDDALICDIAATGCSWEHFARTQKRKLALFTFVFIDSWREATFPASEILASPWLQCVWIRRSSELIHYSTAIEIVNTAPYPSCRRVTRTGDQFSAEFHPSRELPEEVLQAVIGAHGAAMDLLRKHRFALVAELARPATKDLCGQLINALSATSQLNSLGALLKWPPNSGRTTI